MRSRLAPLERALLLGVMLSTLDEDDLSFVLEATITGNSAGSPLPAPDDVDSSARWWADLATQEELAAWLAACFVRLSRRDQLAFIAEAGGRSAA
jgi:hypothetical protein